MINAGKSLVLDVDGTLCPTRAAGEVPVGKPWAGHEDFYVDDRAVRPAEFLALEPDEIAERIARDAVCDR